MIRRSVPLKRGQPPVRNKRLSTEHGQPRKADIPRTKRPRVRLPKRFGTYRERVKYANELWRHLIYRKEPTGVCPCCRRREWHDAAHCFIKGAYPHVRFELSNAAPLCRPCHRRVDYDALEKETFFRRYIGDAEYERLRLLAQSRAKSDLALVILFLEAETAKASA